MEAEEVGLIISVASRTLPSCTHQEAPIVLGVVISIEFKSRVSCDDVQWHSNQVPFQFYKSV
jgi:hypothetical protein